MKRDQTVCKICGSGNLKTGLDHESETGKDLDDQYNFIAKIVAEELSRR